MQRLLAKSRQEGECLVWTGSRRRGYGQIRIHDTVRLVHRVAWIAANGEPPSETPNVLHRCDNPPCFRLDHLFLGSHADNVADKVAKDRQSRGPRPVKTLAAPPQSPPALFRLQVEPAFTDCVVDRRARPWLTANHWIRWRLEDRPSQQLPTEWVFRELQETDLDDPLWLLATLDQCGMIWQPFSILADQNTDLAGYQPKGLPELDDPAATMHIADVRAYLLLLRDMAIECATSEPGEVLLYGLQPGMRPFGLFRIVQNALAGRPPFTPVQVDLYEAGCAQIFSAINNGIQAKQCANSTCGRVFYQKADSTRYGQHRADAMYCSESCRLAAKQRRYRARNRTRLPSNY